MNHRDFAGGPKENNQPTRKMIKKISLMLVSLTLAVSSVWAGTTTYTVTSTESNNHQRIQVDPWYSSGTVFTATMSGVGAGGGVAYALDYNGGTLALVNTGGGAGQPIYGTMTSSPLSASQTTHIMVYSGVSSSGAYLTSTVVANW